MICHECHKDKTADSFYADNSRPRGRVSRCKGCYQAKQKTVRLLPRRRFLEAKSNAVRRGLRWELTFDQYVEWIADGSCFYCGEPHCNGIDRMNNEPFYSMNNAVTCCGPCNQMKSDLKMGDFIERVHMIATKFGTSPMTANASIALE